MYILWWDPLEELNVVFWMKSVFQEFPIGIIIMRVNLNYLTCTCHELMPYTADKLAFSYTFHSGGPSCEWQLIVEVSWDEVVLQETTGIQSLIKHCTFKEITIMEIPDILIVEIRDNFISPESHILFVWNCIRQTSLAVDCCRVFECFLNI